MATEKASSRWKDTDIYEETDRVGTPIEPVVEPQLTRPEFSKQDVTVIVPTLNEACAIVDVLDELKANGLANIIVVDGHSTDETVKLAEEWGAEVITQQGTGKVRAIQSAVKHVITPLVLVIDGDRTYDVFAINEMMEQIQESDEVICARTIGRENIPRVNRLGNRVIGGIFNALFSKHLSDVLSGMYMVRTSILKEMWVETEGFSLEIEVASQVASTTGRLSEVPGNYRPRVGKPKLKRVHGLSILGDAIKLTWRHNPAVFIFALFSALFIPSIYIYAWVVYEFLVTGQRHFVWATIGTVLGGVSAISFSLAILSLYMKRFEYRLLRRLARLEKRE